MSTDRDAGRKVVNIFSLGTIGPLGAGSCVSTGNLIKILSDSGYIVHSFKVGSRTEKRLRYPKYGGYPYRILSMESALKVIKNPGYMNLLSHQLITSEGVIAAAKLIMAGCPAFLRASLDMHPVLIKAWQESGSKILTIREHVSKVLKDQYGLDSVCVPHVWVPSEYAEMQVEKKYHAVTLSRVANVKRMDIVLDANALLPEDRKIHIYGVESRQYTHFKLDKDYPNWREYYHGQFTSGHGVLIAKQADYVVDMSDMGDDGGGTQNTFLEAWEAGCVLVLNKAWYRKGGAVNDNHAMFVKNAYELADVLESPEKWTQERKNRHAKYVKKLLASRSPAVISSKLVYALSGKKVIRKAKYGGKR